MSCFGGQVAAGIPRPLRVLCGYCSSRTPDLDLRYRPTRRAALVSCDRPSCIAAIAAIASRDREHPPSRRHQAPAVTRNKSNDRASLSRPVGVCWLPFYFSCDFPLERPSHCGDGHAGRSPSHPIGIWKPAAFLCPPTPVGLRDHAHIGTVRGRSQ